MQQPKCIHRLPELLLLFLLLSHTTVQSEPLKPPVSAPAPAKGVLLVADHTMPDPRFQRTVILIMQHNAHQGTLGLVLNRPTELTLGQALPDSDLDENKGSLPLRWGGPVSQNNLFIIFHTDKPIDGSRQISTGLFWSAGQETLATLQQSEHDESTLRVFMGVAGWAPGQLDHELSNGGWKLFALQTGAVFYADVDAEDALWLHFINTPAQIIAAR